jgi:hypothetical protein
MWSALCLVDTIVIMDSLKEFHCDRYYHHYTDNIQNARQEAFRNLISKAMNEVALTLSQLTITKLLKSTSDR